MAFHTSSQRCNLVPGSDLQHAPHHAPRIGAASDAVLRGASHAATSQCGDDSCPVAAPAIMDDAAPVARVGSTLWATSDSGSQDFLSDFGFGTGLEGGNESDGSFRLLGMDYCNFGISDDDAFEMPDMQTSSDLGFGDQVHLPRFDSDTSLNASAIYPPSFQGELPSSAATAGKPGRISRDSGTGTGGQVNKRQSKHTSLEAKHGEHTSRGDQRTPTSSTSLSMLSDTTLSGFKWEYGQSAPGMPPLLKCNLTVHPSVDAQQQLQMHQRL